MHLDEHLLIVSKPGGVPSQPDRTGDRGVLDMVRGEHPGAGLVHRLDRPVSGAMLLARKAEALAPCHAMFREHRVRKIYWAIVEGGVEKDATWHHVLKEDRRARRMRVAGDGVKDGLPARLNVRVLHRGDRYSLIELAPVEGRFHQLRAQCAAAGHPIKGDVKYGARRGEPDRSIALHARSLEFDHPITTAHLKVAAPPPASRIWELLLPR